MFTVLTVPNVLTAIRIILIPCFVIAATYERYDYALYIFAGAAITDKLDGMIARVFRTSTPLGAFLDPLADMSMLLTAFAVFFMHGQIPTWVAILVISRNIIIVAGWVLLTLTGHSVKSEPLWSGKLAIAAQFVLLTAVLLRINYGIITAHMLGFLIWTTAALTAVSGLQYIGKGLKIASADKRTGDKD